jgi:hypothetical protein
VHLVSSSYRCATVLAQTTLSCAFRIVGCGYEAVGKFLLFSFCSFAKTTAEHGRGNMSRPLDRQTAALLLVGWLVALVTTLT